MIKDFPVIGILASYYRRLGKYDVSYAYSKWLKSQGCYVIYVYPKLGERELVDIFNKTDGLLIPGGSDHPYDDSNTYKTAKLFFDLAIKHGNYPIMGICMGMQYMLTYFSGDTWDNVKTVVKNHSAVANLRIVGNTYNSILHSIPKEFYSQKIFNVNHDHAITPEFFYNNGSLKEFFNVLSLSHTSNNKYEFVSTIQGKHYPFFGLQWHPEKPNYEWTRLQRINRDPASIISGDIVAAFFVEYCSLTGHKTPQAFIDKYNVESLKQKVFEQDEDTDLERYDEPLVIYYYE